MHRLHAACRAGDSILTANLSNEADIDVDALDQDGLSAICVAAKAGHAGIVAYLVNFGVDISARTPDDLTTNLLYQLCLSDDINQQKFILKWLFDNYSKLKFTDGTQKYHIQLALNLLLNPKSDVLKNPKFNNPKDRLSCWIKAKFNINAAYTLLVAEKVDEGMSYLLAAIRHFASFKPATDPELRTYRTALQTLFILTEKISSDKDKITHIERMYSICKKISENNEADLIMMACDALNLGETYRSLENFEAAKKYYFSGLDHLIATSGAPQAFEKIPDYFQGLSECHPEKSSLRQFYQLAVCCLVPEAKVKNKLIASLNKILNNKNATPEENLAAVALLDAIIHVYNLHLLQNKELLTFINEDDSTNVLEKTRDVLMKRVESYNRFRFFYTTSSGIDNIAIDDNLPPLNLEKTHAWTNEEIKGSTLPTSHSPAPSKPRQ